MDLRKLQRVIVDALEDVKAQDIQVFNTQGITDLFDRVVLATGTSNRQTRSLASHVADEVKKAGGHVISVEGEETGEWLLVDVGDAVVHVMQPAIRSYYNLEEIWGAKPVKIKLGTTAGLPHGAQPSEPEPEPWVASPTPARRSGRVAMAAAAEDEAQATLRRKEAKAARKKAEAAEALVADDAPPARRSAGARTGTKAFVPRTDTTRPTTKPKAKAPAGPRTAAGKSAAAKSGAKPAAKKATARKPAARTLTGLRSADEGAVPVRRTRIRSGQ